METITIRQFNRSGREKSRSISPLYIHKGQWIGGMEREKHRAIDRCQNCLYGASDIRPIDHISADTRACTSQLAELRRGGLVIGKSIAGKYLNGTQLIARSAGILWRDIEQRPIGQHPGILFGSILSRPASDNGSQRRAKDRRSPPCRQIGQREAHNRNPGQVYDLRWSKRRSRIDASGSGQSGSRQ